MRTLELVLAAACGALAATAFHGPDVEAQDFKKVAAGTDRGAVRAGDVKETFRMSDELRGDGVPQSPRELRQRRDVVFVPQHYGELVNMTSADDASVLWYRDEAGELRNAVVASPSTRLVRVVRMETDRLVFNYR